MPRISVLSKFRVPSASTVPPVSAIPTPKAEPRRFVGGMCPTSINDPLTIMIATTSGTVPLSQIPIAAPAAVIRLLAIKATTHYKVPEVLLMFRRIVAFLLCPALLAAGGCTRSDDGTVIVPSRMDVRRVWDKAPPGTTASRQIASDVFPLPPTTTPSAPAGVAPRRYSRPASTTPSLNQNPPDTSSGEQTPLTCRNVGETGKRYRVVCE
ncbi:hypothetical protein SAMN03159463_05822 [Mesorhizobium sp. NFR06]|uniref:hypothetical protein n=1 Tax=Mesorhizobium sp. NFR06 TaxID=1566290 RepID=UPI0008E98BC1|nr:hypothetical protein [Mesorhizobium sp. NFR06]SFQ15925.1 hypothetical protein SAMN03159463_05822 [Mesorhizobium sp. NFR06]